MMGAILLLLCVVCVCATIIALTMLTHKHELDKKRIQVIEDDERLEVMEERLQEERTRVDELSKRVDALTLRAGFSR